ncbi:hypothetical protein Back11_61130 [Paenibacillus baekrokdamisoli]|uniref:AAA domain-containing protein n=1 Tax=Paenibacillus baekrokdamisoli TaxID=1712516 RepID=A0A3G9JKT4_9BACL|nr:AAA family ATPase [Paenibacillus baekrokdamisoli]MBB3072185.1 MinD-like ATPase involved in chromosome partitioning or flagellar assembly [Paenibacillus baekrokdamisoli]BBH24768.1 hypothetical protein Back11_61130 [Paenibacillus baekrokdamisoli]
MSKQSLILAVKEADYIERLADYIRQDAFGENWQLTAFTNPTALRHFIRAGYRADLIVAQQSMLEELGEAAGITPTVVLVAHLGQCSMYTEVIQYQPLPQLLQSFSAVHAASASGDHMVHAEGGAGAVVVSVYSASGGIGKTTLALQLAGQAGMRQARVFYLNLEQWNATSLYFGEEGEDDFSQMLYTLQSQPEKALTRLTQLRKRHANLKIDYFAPCSNAEERLSITSEQAKRLLHVIAGLGQYDMVVVDLDSRLEPLHQAVYEASDHVLWLVSEQSVVLRKTELALKYGEQKWGAAFLEQSRKFRFIQARAQRQEISMDTKLNLRIDGVLPYIAEWDNGGQAFDTFASAAYLGAVDSLLSRVSHVEGGAGDARGSRHAAKG